MTARPPPETLAVLDALPCGVLQARADGTLLRVNQTFCRWIGHGEDELVGKRRFQDLLAIGARIFHQTHWTPLLQMQGSISEVKLDVLHRDGTKIPMVINAVRSLADGEELQEIAAFVARDRDIYERELLASRKRLEQVAAEAGRLEIEAKDRAVLAEQMVGIVSHDLRNPLSSIALATALLSRDPLTDAQRRTLGRIARASDRANRLITDLLDFTKARLGRGLPVQPESMDLHQAVAEGVSELAELHPGRALKHVRIGAGTCMADPQRLIQVVDNLVTNALSYGAADAPITVTSRGDAERCAISVHNFGPAIPPASQAAIFEAMVRGAEAMGGRRSVGLGLFIVREIAKSHGGSASVTSSEGEGTTFTVQLPRMP